MNLMQKIKLFFTRKQKEIDLTELLKKENNEKLMLTTLILNHGETEVMFKNKSKTNFIISEFDFNVMNQITELKSEMNNIQKLLDKKQQDLSEIQKNKANIFAIECGELFVPFNTLDGKNQFANYKNKLQNEIKSHKENLSHLSEVIILLKSSIGDKIDIVD